MKTDKIRRVAHGQVWFSNPEPILKLCRLQCSATRSAYQAIHKHNLKGNDVKKYVKKNYMQALNQRYVADACSIASGINQDNSIFGGKRDWKLMNNDVISKEEWKNRRNNSLYSRGDRTKNGNPNIRAEGNMLKVNIPTERGKWIEGKLHVPKKFNLDSECYDVRLRYVGDGNFKVMITWEEQKPICLTNETGTIGIDINPDGVALVEVDKYGNLLHHHYEKSDRLTYGNNCQRLQDVREIANMVIQYALNSGKQIVMEDLKFTQAKKYKKFNRMSHNFIYRKLSEAIERKAYLSGVKLVKVNPAFTSILGLLKYKDMYFLNRHTSAALVIARRGMGIKERKTFKVEPIREKKVSWKLEARNETIALTDKAWSFLQDGFLKENIATLTGSELATVMSQVPSTGEIPVGEPVETTDHYGNYKKLIRSKKGDLQNKGCKILQVL
jgi:IS605 OrfB family transposase